MLTFFLLLLSPLLVFASPREDAQNLLSGLSSETDIARRMDIASRTFLGFPYGVGGPLGEGPNGRYDQDPLYRFDTFDCTTFVETIMAISLSQDVNEFEKRIDEIRYENGEVDYLTRNHFTDLQWIPFNLRNGYLKEINDEVVPASILKVAVAEINIPGWLKKIKIEEIRVPLATPLERQALLIELQSYASSYSPVTASLTYIPIVSILDNPRLLKNIPHGAIVNFVRPNWDLTEIAGTHQNISHQGFLFWKGKTLYVRHASSAAEKKVVEMPLLDYLTPFRNHATLKGIHLMGLGRP